MRVVRGICEELAPNKQFRFQGAALEALQVAAEEYIVGIYEAGMKCMSHRGRLTLMPKDIYLAMDLRGDQIPRGDNTDGS